MSTAVIDPDVLVPDSIIQPDHDESQSSWLVPDTDIWTPAEAGLPIWTPDSDPIQRSAVPEELATAPNVRFPREIRLGMSGKDIISHKRAISRARPDLYLWSEFTPYAGDFFIDAVVKWKKFKGLGSDRVLGGRAHESLERTHRRGHPSEWAFDAFAIKLAQEYYDETHTTPDERIRNAIVSAGFFWYAHRYAIAYSQYRPFQQGKPPWVPYHWDCSAFTTNCHYAGGAPNPNGRPWDHLGYTGTLMSRGKRVSSVRDLLPGDMIFYGFAAGSSSFPAGSPTHVALYVGYRDGAHMVLSMGSYPMKYIRYDYRHDVNHFRHYQVS